MEGKSDGDLSDREGGPSPRPQLKINFAVSCVLSLITQPGEAHRPLDIITEVKESLADRMPRP